MTEIDDEVAKIEQEEEQQELEQELELTEDPAEEPARASDLLELHSLLQQATAASAEEKRLKQARKRLTQLQKHDHPGREQEQLDLLAEINRLEERRVWFTVGCVALFYRQQCAACGSRHEFFQGWFTVRTHATDKHLRDLRAGEPPEPLPRWIEREDRGTVPVCGSCIECQIAIDVAAGKYPEAVQ